MKNTPRLMVGAVVVVVLALFSLSWVFDFPSEGSLSVLSAGLLVVATFQMHRAPLQTVETQRQASGLPPRSVPPVSRDQPSSLPGVASQARDSDGALKVGRGSAEGL